jgi:signal transduction histidine kinase
MLLAALMTPLVWSVALGQQAKAESMADLRSVPAGADAALAESALGFGGHGLLTQRSSGPAPPVVPTWWQSRRFGGALLLIAVLGVAGGMRWRSQHIRQRARQLESLLETRSEELLQAQQSAEVALCEVRRLQQQLATAEKMASLGQLVAGVAHEINTPVGIAVTAASHLEQLTRKGETALVEGSLKRSDLDQWRAAVKEGTTLILGSLERASRLIGSFKQVAVDQSSEQRRRLDLREFLLEVSTALSPSYRRTGHQLDIDCAAGIELDTYPGALFQIMTNLVSNSLLHGFSERSNGSMRVEARAEGEELVLRYSDDGCGMEADIAVHAFDPFFTTRRGSGGSGLGLHLVYNLCTQLLGGTIELQTAPGEGVQVVMTLPLHAPATGSEIHTGE